MKGSRGHGPKPTMRSRLPVVLALALTVGLVPLGAGASEPEEGEIVEDHAGLEEQGEWTTGVGGMPGMALWFWPEGRRIFQLTGGATSGGGQRGLTAYDADTLVAGTPLDLDPDPWGNGPGNNEWVAGGGRHHVAAVDRTGGRVFVAYKTGVTGFSVADEATGVVSGEAPCASARQVDLGCVGGIHVVDGASMERLGQIRLDLPTAEGPRAHAVPRALEWVPEVPQRGWGGRVLMLVEEFAHSAVEPMTESGLVPASENTIARRNNANIMYAVAFDPESMRQEWAVRVEGCRNSREPRGWNRVTEGHPATVFRAGGAAPALFVGCHGNPSQQGVVARIPLDERGIPAGLPLRVGDPVASIDPSAEDGGLGGLVEPAPRQEVYVGPDDVRVILSDPVSQRILMRVEDAGEVWWVFDGKVNQFIGTIGIGDYRQAETTAGIDEDTGRLYVFAARASSGSAPGGLYLADIRRDPLPQALVYRHIVDSGDDFTARRGHLFAVAGYALSVEPSAEGGVARLFATASGNDARKFRVIEDRTEVSVDPESDDVGVVRTLDLDEAAGVTDATFDGTARGFGFRAILLGGAEGAARVGPADPVGWVRGVPQFGFRGGGGTSHADRPGQIVNPLPPRLPRQDPCTDAQRELIVAFVGPEGPAVVDASSSRGEAQPVLADVRTREDAGAPVTRCGPADWPELWRSAMVSQPPVSEPGAAWPFDGSRSSCTATDGDDRESWSDPVAGMFSSGVQCSQDEVGGWGQARGLSVDGVSVANTLSSFRIYRDPQRGLVARVESIARGVDIGGIVKIDTIRGVAESWANGRLAAAGFHDPDLERELGLAGDEDTSGVPTGEDGAKEASGAEEEEFNPFNCDTTRPAGTCFERHVFGVTVTDPDNGEVWRCGPCGPEEDFLEAMNRAFGAYGQARFREPDAGLARGSDDGYIAAITKPDHERFADIVMNADLLETMVPMLEVIRYAPHNRQSADAPGNVESLGYSTGTPPRGRQVYQFAAVEVSSTYSIQCLLEYDAVTNVCAEPEVPASSLTVELIDLDGEPLAGGAFELRRDTDGDSVLGLVDELVEGGACATGPEGVCAFDGLEPGSYLVSQTAAPGGYAPVDEPLAVSLFPGDDLTVTFTNVPNVSTISLTVTDLDGAPVVGAVFGVFPDAGYVASASVSASPGDVEPVATCTTDADGVCAVTVPPGAYVLRQLSAPDGLLPVDDIAFVISQAGQTADVALTLGAAGTDPVLVTEPAPGPIDDFAPAPAPLVQPAVSVAPAPARAAPSVMATPPALAAPPPAIAEQVGGTVIRVIRAPAGALRLAARSPIEAAAMAMVFLLVGLAVMAVLRRRQLATLLAAPAFAGASGAVRATAVLERPVHAPPVRAPVPAYAPPAPAPVVTRLPHLAVVVATDSSALAATVVDRLDAAEGCDLVAAVDTAEGLSAALADRSPDVTVVDLGLPVDAAGGVCDLVAGLHEPGRTIGLVPKDGPVAALVARGRAADLGGLLIAEDDLGNGNLAFTVRQAARGRRYYGPAVQALLREAAQPRKRGRKPAEGFTERERDIAVLTAQGFTRREIAERLWMSPATVKWYLRAVRDKLGVADPGDRELLERRLAESGLLEDPGPPSRPEEFLTDRERDIAVLVAQGLSRPQIAEWLGLSPKTVQWYVRAVRDKLGVADPSDPELLRCRLREHGMLDDEPDEG